MNSRFALTRRNKCAISLSELEKQKKDKKKPGHKTERKNKKMSASQLYQLESCLRLSSTQKMPRICQIESNEVALEPEITQSRIDLENQYNVLWEQYQDVMLESQELRNQKKALLLEVASIKKQQIRLQQLIELAKSGAKPDTEDKNSKPHEK